MEKSYFFITTNGHSASRWVAQTLNMHNNIICSHSPARVSIAMAYDHAYTDHEFKLIMSDEIRKNIPVDNLLDELEEIGEAACYGNVHLFNLRQLQDNLKKYDSKKKFLIVDLLRHPVSFVNSGTYNMIRQARYNIDRLDYLKNVYLRNKRLYDDFSAKHKLELGNLQTLSFMANVMTLKSLAINMQITNVDRRITMEKVTNCKEEYGRFVNFISQGKREVDDQYIDAVFRTKAINKHKTEKAPTSAKEIYNAWEGWKKDFFKLLIELTCLDQHYNTFGYDFSFLENTN
jgi:hypothetical protein